MDAISSIAQKVYTEALFLEYIIDVYNHWATANLSE